MKRLMSTILVMLFASGCSSTSQENYYENELTAISHQNKQLQHEIELMQEAIEVLEAENERITDLLSEEEIIYTGGLQYEWFDEDESRRYVSKELVLLALPYTGALVINHIEPNTLF